MQEHEPLTFREILTGHVQPRVKVTDTATVAEYPHLSFSNIEHYLKTLAYAEQLSAEALQSLKDCLSTLERWSARDEEPCDVHPDCDKYSFYFRFFRKDGKCGLDGGVILHGLEATHSVELVSKKGIYWSIHT